MKSHLPLFHSRAAVMLLLTISAALFSCSKEIIETNIGQAVDLAVVAGFKYQLTQASSLDDLPASVKSASTDIAAVLSNEEIALYSQANLDAEATALKGALVLTSAEMSGLKANHPESYDAVIGRLANVISFAPESDLELHHAALKANPLFQPLLAGRTASGLTIYENRDYQAVLDLQKVLDAYLVQTLQKVQSLKKSTAKSGIMPPNGTPSAYDREVATLVTVILDQAYTILQPYREKCSWSYKGGKN